MTLRNDEKPEEELTWLFDIGIRNFTNFDSRTWKSQKFAFYWAAFDQSMYIMFELRKYRWFMFDDTE